MPTDASSGTSQGLNFAGAKLQCPMLQRELESIKELAAQVAGLASDLSQKVRALEERGIERHSLAPCLEGESGSWLRQGAIHLSLGGSCQLRCMSIYVSIHPTCVNLFSRGGVYISIYN